VPQAASLRNRLPQGLPGRRPAITADSATALVIATLIGGSLTFWHQAACRAGALSSGLILAAFINWDLIAMALTAAAMAAWAKRRGILAGVLFGLATATKLYPLILLTALFPLCLRAGRLRAFWVTTRPRLTRLAGRGAR
jgi:uncharacterized membrane protein